MVILPNVTKDYGSTVTNNFFHYLEHKKITQKQYADDNLLNQSLLSKWKKGDSSLTLDQVIQAAKYFSITVNDLVYSDKEKKHLEVLSDKSYDPIIAQQSLKVKIYGNTFKKPLRLVLRCILIFTIITFMMYMLRNNSPFYLLLTVLGLPLLLWMIRENSFKERNFIINYLDDIFYYRIEPMNGHYIQSIVIRFVSFLSIFYYSTLITKVNSTVDIEYGLLATLILSLIVLVVSFISSITDLPRKFKQKIEDYEITGYYSSLFYLLVHLWILTIASLLCIYNLKLYYPSLIISAIMFGFNTIDFTVLSKEYSKYELMYQENDKDPRNLFPKVN